MLHTIPVGLPAPLLLSYATPRRGPHRTAPAKGSLAHA